MRRVVLSLGLLVCSLLALFFAGKLLIESVTNQSSLYTFSGQYSDELHGFAFSNIPEGWSLNMDTPLDESPLVFSWDTGVLEATFDVYVSTHELESLDLIALGHSESYYYYYASLDGLLSSLSSDPKTSNEYEAAKEVWLQIQRGVVPSFAIHPSIETSEQEFDSSVKVFPASGSEMEFPRFEYPADWREGGGSFYTADDREVLRFVLSTDLSSDGAQCADRVKDETYVDERGRTWNFSVCGLLTEDQEKSREVILRIDSGDRMDPTDPVDSSFLFFYYQEDEESTALAEFHSILDSMELN